MGTLPKTGTASVLVDAPPEAVYALVSDVTRTGEWSHETQSADWLDGATHAAPGARFKGRNKQGRSRWSRTCEVVTADAPHAFAFRTVPTRVYRDSTLWSFTIEPTDGGGCRLTQRFEGQIGPVMDRIFYVIVPAHRDRTAALTEDLQRLGQLAGAATPATT